jgi:phage terminase large subunit-like protein
MATPKRPSKPARHRKKTRGQRNVAWIEAHCRVPEGKDVGKRLVLRPWQKRDICKIYDNPYGTRTAILSFGKKNGKTALAACLLLLHLVGPEAKPNSQLPSTAQSKDQAAVLYKLAAKMVRMSPSLAPYVVTRDTVKELFCPELGTLYKALSAEVATAHGQSPIFAVHDELGQVQGPVSELYNAIENAMGAHDAPLSIIISTQAPTDADLLSVLIDDALSGQDPHTVVSLYTAPLDLDPFSEAALKKANPAAGDFLNIKELRGQAEKARRLPSQEPLYRNYTLNQRVELQAPFVSRSLWQSVQGPIADFAGLSCYGGLDLSETTDLCAFVLMAHHEGRWHVRPTFWLPEEGLRERARQDRVPYDLWQREGHLIAVPGKSIEYKYVADHLRDVFNVLSVQLVNFDRWNFKHLKPWLLEAGFSEAEIAAHFGEFGQGFQSMSPAVRDLETSIVNDKLRHGGNPVMTMCAANAVVQRDPAGNRKLNKAKSRGRIDGMVALTMAHAAASTHAIKPAAEFQLMVFGGRPQ